MAPSSTVVSSPGRRHHLSPGMNDPLLTSIPSNSARRTTPTKRPLFNDENADPTLSKRVKSILSPSKSISSIDGILKPSTPPKSRFILTDKPVVNPQPKRPLSNITNTHQRVSKVSHKSAKPLVGSSLKKAYIPSSPTRHVRAASPQIGSGRGGPSRRTRSSTPPIVLRDASPHVPADAAAATAPTPMQQQQPIPDSWIFDIYEDTPEETLQNLMEFGTHTLDISDTEETADPGKENIPPSRTPETLLPSAPTQHGIENHTPIQDFIAKCTPQRRVLRERRQPLREMKEEELYPEKQQEEEQKQQESGKLPTLPKESFIRFSTPEKKKPQQHPPLPEWKIWESDHEDDEEPIQPHPITCRKRALEE